MTTLRNVQPVDQEMQCWLLTACCAFYPEHHASYPELRALRQAIKDRHRPSIAIALEVVCSHLSEELSAHQLQLTQRLANSVRRGDYGSTRRLVLDLSRATINEQRRAC